MDRNEDPDRILGVNEADFSARAIGPAGQSPLLVAAKNLRKAIGTAISECRNHHDLADYLTDAKNSTDSILEWLALNEKANGGNGEGWTTSPHAYTYTGIPGGRAAPVDNADFGVLLSNLDTAINHTLRRHSALSYGGQAHVVVINQMRDAYGAFQRVCRNAVLSGPSGNGSTNGEAANPSAPRTSISR